VGWAYRRMFVAIQVVLHGVAIFWRTQGDVRRQELPTRRCAAAAFLAEGHGAHHGRACWPLAPRDVALWRTLLLQRGLVGPLARQHGGDQACAVRGGQVAVGESVVRMSEGVRSRRTRGLVQHAAAGRGPQRAGQASVWRRGGMIHSVIILCPEASESLAL